jgi:4-amino-4-deoxy-L-arabinose transferase-like glycosyltransferase
VHPGVQPRSLLILLFLLIPSAAYLWHFDDLPQFGDFHDDGLYFVSAKSLADGGGYRIESLPGEPAQTKYPPLYPLLLSIAWRIDPQFPRNLPIAAWISWLAFPAMLVQLAAYYPRLGISGWRAWLLLSLIAINPYIIFFSSQLLTELLFLALILSTMLLVEQAVERNAAPVWAIAAGVVGGLAYLTRSAGIVMLAAAFVYFWLKKERRKGGYFAAAMLPFIAGWMIWSRLHQLRPADTALMYYTDYLGYQIYNVSLRSAHLLLWKNIDGLLWGLGGLIQPKVTSSQFLKILALVMAVAMISGVVRMLRRGQGVLYALFAAGTILILVVWHFPPNERFVLPLFPLALAGLLVELEHLFGMLRTSLHHRDLSQRIVAGVLSTVVVAILVGSVALEMFVAFSYLPDDAHDRRLVNADRVAAYGWIIGHVPKEANILAGDDPVVFLYTGRHAISHPLPPMLWYQEDRPGMIDWLSNPGSFAHEHGLTYFEFAGVDARQGLREEDRDAVASAIPQNPDYAELYKGGPVTIYGLRPR